jgi:hypothetical protein
MRKANEMKKEDQIYFDRDTGKGHLSARSLVDAYIARFSNRVSAATGSNIKFNPLDDDGYSFVVRGSATVGINVLEDHGLILLLSKIMAVPNKRQLEFFRKLLELNYSATSNAAFAIDKQSDNVYLRASRPVSGLDYEEFEEMLHAVATVADEWDDKLIAEFEED